MPIHVKHRVQKRREALKASGLRPVQIWLPDTRRAGFDQQCRLQSGRVAEADRQDHEMLEFLDSGFADIASGVA